MTKREIAAQFDREIGPCARYVRHNIIEDNFGGRIMIEFSIHTVPGRHMAEAKWPPSKESHPRAVSDAVELARLLTAKRLADKLRAKA